MIINTYEKIFLHIISKLIHSHNIQKTNKNFLNMTETLFTNSELVPRPKLPPLYQWC